jgi:hypothetical protein
MLGAAWPVCVVLVEVSKSNCTHTRLFNVLLNQEMVCVCVCVCVCVFTLAISAYCLCRCAPLTDATN